MVARAERVEARVRWYTPRPQPNGGQAVGERVWVIGQDEWWSCDAATREMGAIPGPS